MKQVWHSLIEWVSVFVLWMLLVAKWNATESFIGILAATVALVGIRLVARQSRLYLKAGFSELMQGWRLSWYAIQGTIEILRALARELLPGKKADNLLRAARYLETGDEPESQALRVLAVTYTCATPNFVVLGIDREHGYLLYHQILRGPVLTLTQKLGASK